MIVMGWPLTFGVQIGHMGSGGMKETPRVVGHSTTTIIFVWSMCLYLCYSNNFKPNLLLQLG